MTEVDSETFTFTQLSDAAKAQAREDYTGPKYLDYDWHTFVIEDARCIAKIFGIHTINIHFSGFSSQGDGACFTGGYAYNDAAVKQIADHTTDEELIRIATELTAMQILQRLKGLGPFRAQITSRGNYCHSGTMATDIYDWNNDSEIGEPDEKQFLRLMRDFADWIYKQLEAEYDYLHSDEYVDQYLVDQKFDEDGTML